MEIQAFLVCQAAHRDLMSGQWSLLGIVRRLEAPPMPEPKAPLFAYAAFLDIRRTTQVRVRLTKDIPGRPSHETIGESGLLSLVAPKNANRLVEIASPIGSFGWQDTGWYAARLMLGDVEVAVAPFVVTALRKWPKPRGG